MLSLPQYKSLCDWCSRNVTCVLSALSSRCLAAISPLAAHDTTVTDFVNQSCTWVQMCTCKIFGQKHQNFRRYRFVPRYRNVGVWFTKPVALYAAMGEILNRTACAERRQRIRHMSTSIAQAFVFGWREHRFELQKLYLLNFNNTPTTVCPYIESNFARGWPDGQGTLGLIWRTQPHKHRNPVKTNFFEYNHLTLKEKKKGTGGEKDKTFLEDDLYTNMS